MPRCVAVVEPQLDFVGFEPGSVSVRSSVAKEFHSEHKQLEAAGNQLASSGVNVVALQIQGPAVEKIIEESIRQDADMIILGSHGHGALFNLLAGSVAQGVLKSATCLVLIVPCRASV